MRLIDADALLEAIRTDIMGGLNYERFIREAPTIEPTNTDLISREDAINAVWKLEKEATEYVVDDAQEIHGYCTAIGVCVGELSALPSADRPQGAYMKGENNECK